jgi:8-oxo-dGTP pyrophosphatase MutT (NUDIX family)
MSEPSYDDYTATLPRKRIGAAVLFTDGEGRALLVEPAYKDDWEIPGGCVDADESPYDAAVREPLWLLGQVGAGLALAAVDRRAE